MLPQPGGNDRVAIGGGAGALPRPGDIGAHEGSSAVPRRTPPMRVAFAMRVLPLLVDMPPVSTAARRGSREPVIVLLPRFSVATTATTGGKLGEQRQHNVNDPGAVAGFQRALAERPIAMMGPRYF